MRISNVTFSYGDRSVFENASFEFKPGLNLIMGPSGCGKTTLLKLITGVLQPEGIKPSLGSAHCLLVLQEDALLPWMSGRDNIVLFLKKAGVPTDSIEGLPLYSLIAEFIGQFAWEMSYGQRRSIELFRALASRPDILCLDEPLNFIDVDRRKQLAAEIISSRAAKYTIVSTHEPADFSPPVSTAQYFDGHFPVKALLHRSLVVAAP